MLPMQLQPQQPIRHPHQVDLLQPRLRDKSRAGGMTVCQDL
jgi:hypothetical protein